MFLPDSGNRQITKMPGSLELLIIQPRQLHPSSEKKKTDRFHIDTDGQQIDMAVLDKSIEICRKNILGIGRNS